MTGGAELSLGGQIRDARLAAGMALRELARQLEKAPSYLNDIENNRRVPSEAVLRQICGILPTLDIEQLLALAGRVGEHAEEYLRANPRAGILLRRVSAEGFDEQQLQRLLDTADEIVRERDENPET